MSDEGEIRPAVVNTTTPLTAIDADNDFSFSIARDHAWEQSAEGNLLLRVEIPGLPLPFARLTGDWVMHPFGEVRLNDYVSLPEPHCSELAAFKRLRRVFACCGGFPLGLGEECHLGVLRHPSEPGS